MPLWSSCPGSRAEAALAQPLHGCSLAVPSCAGCSPCAQTSQSQEGHPGWGAARHCLCRCSFTCCRPGASQDPQTNPDTPAGSLGASACSRAGICSPGHLWDGASTELSSALPPAQQSLEQGTNPRLSQVFLSRDREAGMGSIASSLCHSGHLQQDYLWGLGVRRRNGAASLVSSENLSSNALTHIPKTGRKVFTCFI